VRTKAPHLRRPREPRGRRNESAAWPDLPQLRHYPCEDSAPPARPRPALLERAAFANPHDDCGSRILDVERQQKGDDGRLVPPEEHAAGAARAMRRRRSVPVIGLGIPCHPLPVEAMIKAPDGRILHHYTSCSDTATAAPPATAKFSWERGPLACQGSR
jgi:hypothetical protein